MQKRNVRLSRLESNLKDLVKVQNKHPKGLKLSKSHSTPRLSSSKLFNSFHSVPHSLRGLPTPPFLVPAVLDALSTSKYAAITAIVPGEADTFCAKAAKDHGGMILTSDSDMLVYDIGSDGAVVFFNGLEIQEELDSTAITPVLKASIYTTAQIAKRLRLPGLQQLAYQYKNDPYVSFAEARRKVHQPMQDESLWRSFLEEYTTQDVVSTPLPQSLSNQQQGFLDPRLSELILQLSIPTRQDETNMYLPFLVDDPSRASAWYVSSAIRRSLYDMLATHIPTVHTSTPLQAIMEFSRRGLRIVASTIPLSTTPDPAAQRVDTVRNINALSFRLHLVKSRFRKASPMFQYRIFALGETYRWYIDNFKAPPSRSSIARTMTGGEGSLDQWEDIHLEAQVQAVLYALRMVQQSLRYIDVGRTESEELGELEKLLEDLPPLSGLIPSSMELRGYAEKEKIDIAEVVCCVTEP
ncbi:MAG: hypothetical protein Q9213_000581 [Squamulea squamosa]